MNRVVSTVSNPEQDYTENIMGGIVVTDVDRLKRNVLENKDKVIVEWFAIELETERRRFFIDIDYMEEIDDEIEEVYKIAANFIAFVEVYFGCDLENEDRNIVITQKQTDDGIFSDSFHIIFNFCSNIKIMKKVIEEFTDMFGYTIDLCIYDCASLRCVNSLKSSFRDIHGYEQGTRSRHIIIYSDWEKQNTKPTDLEFVEKTFISYVDGCIRFTED